MKRKRGRKSVCVTAKQRTEAAFFRMAIRRVFQSILDDMRAEMRRKLDEPTVVDKFCEALANLPWTLYERDAASGRMVALKTSDQQ